jgi:hypothetical protein
MNKEIKSAAISYQAVRLDLAVRETYDDFRQRFEFAVPMWNRERAIELVERRASWPEVVSVTASTPHGFLLYWRLDVAPLMSLAGNTRRATEYLMGNHIIAETVYRHDPGVTLYVPLRCAIYESGQGTKFSIEQPSANLSSLGRNDIAEVGVHLDRKLAKLLSSLQVEAPAVLTESGVFG